MKPSERIHERAKKRFREDHPDLPFMSNYIAEEILNYLDEEYEKRKKSCCKTDC